MGVEGVRTYSTTGNMDKLSTPPGFVSQTSFLLKKVNHNDEGSVPSPSRQPSRRASGQEEITLFNMDDVESLKRSLGSRPWILHDQTTLSSEASDSMKSEVVARRLPKVSKAQVLEEALVFHPTEEEFSDTLAYIASIRHRAEQYGICRVVPPPSWKPPSLLEEKKIWKDSTFSSQVQLFGAIENRRPKKREANGGAMNNATAEKVGYCRIDHGPEYTLDRFKNFADSYKKQHFSMKDGLPCSKKSSPSPTPPDPSVADIECEYRQLVENPTVEIGVLCGNDLDTRVFGSGFPPSEASESCKYIKSGWNLNNTAKLPGSLLSLEDCESACVPRLCVGMCFSSQLWKVEKHSLYSLCYLHLGAPRVWYAVPGHHSFNFKATMKSFIPDLLIEDPEMHHKPVMKMSPYALSIEGIPVSRCIQNPGEFVVIFPGSYYSGFDCGFNCSEKVNFAPLDWLPHGETAVQLYQEKRKKTLISHDKLLLAAAREVVRCQWESSWLSKKKSGGIRWKDACGKDGILSKALKSRIKRERSRMEYLSSPYQSQRMDKNYDAMTKRECCVCFWDLHLSAVQCSCTADRFSCLNHAKQLCSCARDKKIFLYRYTIDELNVLVEALEGKLSAVYKWARQDLKFSLHSSISGDSTTSDPRTKGQNRKPDETLNAATSCDTRNTTAASIKAQVKERVKARSVEEIMRAKEDKGASPAVVGGKTNEKLRLKREMAPEDLLESLSVSSSSESDDACDPRIEAQSSLLRGCSSSMEEADRSSMMGSKSASSKFSSQKKPKRSSDTSASSKPKKQKEG